MPLPSPVHNNIGSTNTINNNKPNYLVIDGRLTKEGAEYLKILNVYSKAERRYRFKLELNKLY